VFRRVAALPVGSQPTPKVLCKHNSLVIVNTIGGAHNWWVESTGVCFQSLARRSRYSIRPLKFECDCFLTQNAFSGTGTARHLGPNSTRPAQIWPYACVPDPIPNRSKPSREGRASVCSRAILSAASARYLPIGDSLTLGRTGTTAVSRNGDIESLPNLLF